MDVFEVSKDNYWEWIFSELSALSSFQNLSVFEKYKITKKFILSHNPNDYDLSVSVITDFLQL